MARRAAANSEDAKALDYATSYHRQVQSLYRSQYSEVSYGRGGEDEIRWSYRYPTKYKKAGVRLDYGRKLLVIENYRGKLVAEVPIFLMNGKLVGIGDRKYVLLPKPRPGCAIDRPRTYCEVPSHRGQEVVHFDPVSAETVVEENAGR